MIDDHSEGGLTMVKLTWIMLVGLTLWIAGFAFAGLAAHLAWHCILFGWGLVS